MPFFGSSSQQSDSSLGLPAQKRISAPNAQRLTTITEGGAGGSNLAPAPPIPRRSSRRNSGASHSFSHSNSKRWSGSTETTQRSAPPPYDWVPEPVEGSSARVPAPDDDEKLARLRRGEDGREKRRGGWKRLALIIGVVLLVVIALAVGLGVGLTRKKSSGSDNGQQSSSPDATPPQKFPLGQYSAITALKTIEYGCTSNQATWRCWPYTIFSPSTNDTSLASFNLLISNTDDIYATASSPSTPAEGVPANLTASSNDPFGIVFTNKPLTYISPSANSSAARLVFTYTMNKIVVPDAAITTDNANSKCFFNETIFTGTLYLASQRTYPDADQQHSSSLGGYEQWPHAVEITQAAYGGTNVPNCYETNDGQLGTRITYGLTPMPSTNECLCDYRNF